MSAKCLSDLYHFVELLFLFDSLVKTTFDCVAFLLQCTLLDRILTAKNEVIHLLELTQILSYKLLVGHGWRPILSSSSLGSWSLENNLLHLLHLVVD